MAAVDRLIGAPRVRRLTAYEQLLEAAGGDPFVRYAVARPLSGPAYAAGEAVGFVACGAMELAAGAYPVLSGIAVEPALRGSGLGRALTATLTREAVERYAVSTLGMYSSSDVARSVHLSLGYRIGQAWATFTLD